MATTIEDLDMPSIEHLDPDVATFYEVVDGRIVENPPLWARESVLASKLQGLMGSVAISNGLGRVVMETLFLIDRVRKPHRRPDVAFVSKKRWSFKRVVPDAESWDVVPDLAIEVISRTYLASAVNAKIDEYFQAGVSLVWVIYPVTTKIYVYDSPTSVRILQLGDELDGEGVVPGFQVPLSTMFG